MSVLIETSPKPTPREEPASLRFGPVLPVHATLIANWPCSIHELFHLAPSTLPPLTASKVLAWVKPGGRGYVLTEPASQPIAYGELNTMRGRPDEFWIGHVITDPLRRGEGLGRELIHQLIGLAFSRLGAVLVKLIVFPDNAAAIHCYKRAGFCTVGEEYHGFPTVKSLQRLLRMELSLKEWLHLNAISLSVLEV